MKIFMSAHSYGQLMRTGDEEVVIDYPPFMVFHHHLRMDYWSFRWHGIGNLAHRILAFLGDVPSERMSAKIHAEGGLVVTKIDSPQNLILGYNMPATRIVVIRRFDYRRACGFTLYFARVCHPAASDTAVCLRGFSRISVLQMHDSDLLGGGVQLAPA